MNVRRVLRTLKRKYPGKNIVKNDASNPTEIICEVSPASEYPDYSVAVAVIDKSNPHFHKQSTETYEVIRGELTVKKNGAQHHLKQSESLTIFPKEIHEAKGDETWVQVTSHPGWRLEDHSLTSSP